MGLPRWKRVVKKRHNFPSFFLFSFFKFFPFFRRSTNILGLDLGWNAQVRKKTLPKVMSAFAKMMESISALPSTGLRLDVKVNGRWGTVCANNDALIKK